MAIIEIDLNPDVLARGLSPQISATDKEPPDFSVLSVDSIPDATSAEELAPGFSIKRVADQVPDAEPEEPSNSPSVKIRTIEDLVPEIVKKDD